MQAKPIPEVTVSFFRPSPLLLITRLAEEFTRHGDVVKLKMWVPLHVFCFRKPEHIKLVYAHKTAGIVKPPRLMKKADWLMGNGIFNDQGKEWKHRKAVSGPNFERGSSEQYCQNIPAIIARHFPRWDHYAAEGRTVDIYYELRRLVIDLSFNILLSESLEERLDQVCQDTHFAESMFTTQTPLWIPTPSNLRYRKTAKRFWALMHRIVREHREKPEQYHDILASILHTTDPQLGRTWTNQEAVDEMFSIYFGASAMSSPLAWALYLLAQHPPVLKKVLDELAPFRNREITVADTHQLPYLDMVLNETNRLYPPFWGSPRYATDPIEIDGYSFPKNSILVPIRYFAQRHPDYWKNPEAFEPERFSPERRADYHPVAFLPFGAGPRSCLGQHMAPIICKFILATLVLRYRLEFYSRFPNDPQIDFSFGVYPKDKIPMRFAKNQASAAGA
ncbi:MAG: cytochrome P450 [Pseudomonadota bacterium]|nr:cytochrome P450 [Pseudomonadota bacterium]MDE3038654.1 cytochrome P450 [Pseudomonadota bacterium]